MMNTIKNTLTTLSTLSLITISASQAFAKPGPFGPRRGSNTPVAPAVRPLNVDASDFGALRDKFIAYQLLTNGGAKYYGKSDQTLRAEHISIYQMIQRLTLEDRLAEEDAREYIEELFTIGELHLTSPDTAAAYQKLEGLKQDIRSEAKEKVPAEALTPRLNRMQFHMEEAIRFGEENENLSTGELSSIRRKLDSLESKEDKYKTDDEISDREREKLIQEALEIWRDALDDFD
ncbi:hypothetical protein ACFPK9_11935 [Rubritalea spongiae]|uniref:Uncharacterized protein n=1 Tax=Rubritalea spongiae TaxID=430797 RepID=A0ABW5E0L4_9BACT